jgi:hypothetical protein
MVTARYIVPGQQVAIAAWSHETYRTGLLQYFFPKSARSVDEVDGAHALLVQDCGGFAAVTCSFAQSKERMSSRNRALDGD